LYLKKKETLIKRKIEGAIGKEFDDLNENFWENLSISYYNIVDNLEKETL
jgi:hypothetical protein